MISALRKIENRGELQGRDPSGVMEMCIDNPRGGFENLFDTHPSVDKRVDALVRYAGGHDPGAASPFRKFDDPQSTGDRPTYRRRAGCARGAPAGARSVGDRRIPAAKPFLPSRPPIELGAAWRGTGHICRRGTLGAARWLALTPSLTPCDASSALALAAMLTGCAKRRRSSRLHHRGTGQIRFPELHRDQQQPQRSDQSRKRSWQASFRRRKPRRADLSLAIRPYRSELVQVRAQIAAADRATKKERLRDQEIAGHDRTIMTRHGAVELLQGPLRRSSP